MWREPELAEKHELFSGIIRDAEPCERILMLFSLMSRLLLGIGEKASRDEMTVSGLRVLAAISFLRQSLSDKPADPFHGAFKRFYSHLHRQIIDAVRDHQPKGFLAAGRSISILITEVHADVFIAHCLEQSEWQEHRLVFILDRLFVIAPDRVLEPAVSEVCGSGFIPLRSA